MVLLSSCYKNTEPIITQSSSSPVPFSLKINMSNAPANVSFIEGLLERNGYDPIIKQFIIEGDTASADFGQIASGLWHLSVTAYDSIQTAIYFGETDVNILPGQVNTVYLQLDPLTGDLVVVVTWGDPISNTSEYILFFSHSGAQNNVYRFNLQTSSLEQLTFVNRAVHQEYLSNIEKIVYQMKDQNEMWIMNSDGSNKQFYFNLPLYHPYSPKYCTVTDKIYYYTIESYRKLAFMDYNGQNVQYLTINESYNNLSPDINTNGDSLLFHSDRSGVFNIFLLDLSNMSQSQLTYSSNTICHLALWSKIKNGFYYKSGNSSGNYDLMFYNFSDQSSEQILHFDNLYFEYYVLSPNEDKIAFILSNSSNQSDPRNLYIYDIATGSMSQKTFDNLLLSRPQWYVFNE